MGAMDITIEVQKLEASKMEATIAILVFYFVIAVMAASLSHVSFRYMLFEFEGKFGTLRKRTLEKQKKKNKTNKQLTSTFAPVNAVIRWRNIASRSATSPDQPDTAGIELGSTPTPRSLPATPRAHALHESRTTGRAGCDKDQMPTPTRNLAFDVLSPAENHVFSNIGYIICGLFFILIVK